MDSSLPAFVLLCAVALLSFAPPSHAAPGDLDATFGSGGKVTTRLRSNSDVASSVAVQSDGKIVVAGTSYNGATPDFNDFALARYTSTGALDTSFGSGGKVITPIGDSQDYGSGVALQSDGKIIVAGTAVIGGYEDFAVVRYTSAGALDTSFGSGGKVTTPIGGSHDFASSVALQSDGKIVVAGSSVIDGYYEFAVVRYTSTGALDTSFGSGGKVTTSIGPYHDYGNSVAVQSDGKIVVVGDSALSTSGTQQPQPNNPSLVRYTSTGALDASFGSGGKVTTFDTVQPASARSVALQSDGKIVVAGGVSGPGFGLRRYTSTGALDASFGTGGKVATFFSGNSSGTSVALQSDGRIVVAGYASDGSGNDFALARYTDTGALDPGFSNDGKVTTPIGSGTNDYGWSVAVQSDGKIVVAGSSDHDSKEDFALARYLGNPPDAEIEVEQVVGIFLVDGTASIGLGSVEVGNSSGALMFTIRNVGNVDLTGLAMTRDGANGSDFNVSGLGVTTLAPGTSTTFTVAFTPGAAGSRAAAIHIASNDDDENPFDIALTGTGLDPGQHATHEAHSSKGEFVPGAGGGRIPFGAVWRSFGMPAINDAGAVVFVGKWSSFEGIGRGVFVNDILVAKVGDSTPLLGSATFVSFKDPVLDAHGHIAFLATVSGPGVNSLNDSVLVTDAFGALEVVAREGAATPELGAPTLRKILGVSLVDGEVLFTAKLNDGSPAVTSLNDDIAFRVSAPGEIMHVVREGDAFGPVKVRSFSLLEPVSGSPGQNRGHAVGTATFRAVFSNGVQALMSSTGGELSALVVEGYAVSDPLLPQARFKSFGPVAADASRLAFRAMLYPGTGGVSAANAEAIFSGEATNLRLIARAGRPTFVGSTVFAALGDPVLAPGTDSVAFPAMLSGVSSATDATLWWKPTNGPLTLLAREGARPEGLPTGTKWESFPSLALPGGEAGPIFVATLEHDTGGVDASNDKGVWAVDSIGILRLLFRKGDTIEGRELKGFTVLNAVSSSPGVTRSFNNHGQLVWRATFTDGSNAIVVTQVL